MAKKARRLIIVGRGIYFISSNTKIGRHTTPFGQELYGFKFSIGSKGIPRIEAVAGCDVMDIVFNNPDGSRRSI